MVALLARFLSINYLQAGTVIVIPHLIVCGLPEWIHITWQAAITMIILFGMSFKDKCLSQCSCRCGTAAGKQPHCGRRCSFFISSGSMTGTHPYMNAANSCCRTAASNACHQAWQSRWQTSHLTVFRGNSTGQELLEW
jgi:hypothetical protein